MAIITLYKPDGSEQFTHPTNVAIHGAVLTFDWKKDATALLGKRIRTTVPFLIEEDTDGSHSV
jgi:hypothetical protein